MVELAATNTLTARGVKIDQMESKTLTANPVAHIHKFEQRTRGFLQKNLKSPEAKKFIAIENQDDVSKSVQSTCLSPDVDGGWAWMVFAAGFLQFFVSSGMYYSFSVFYVELLQTFGESRAKTGWIYSTNSAVHMFSGPLGGYVIIRYGSRFSIMLGGILAGLGYFLTAFAPSLNIVFITFGFINAVGTSLNFSGWVVGLSQFWKKQHALVVGIAMAGSGCGVFLLGPCMEAIVLHYGWRGAMLICSGMSLNFCVFGATIYNQLKPYTAKKVLAKGKYLHEGVSGLPVKLTAESENLIYSTEESIGSHEASVSSRDWEGDSFLETPTFASHEISKSSLSSGESSTSQDKLKNLLDYIVFVKNIVVKKFVKKNLSSEDSSENGSAKHLLCSPTFWLLEASCFCSFMATTTVFAVLLDWTSWIGMAAVFPHALAGSGAGDILGRLVGGIVMGRGLPPLILFSGIQLLLASTIGCASLSVTEVQLIASLVGFGIACGLQSVLYALMPSQLSSGIGMARVLGYLLLVTGAGALTGPPVAGLLVDLTESYNAVLIFCTAAPAAAAVFNLAAYFTSRRHHHQARRESPNVQV